MEQDGILLKNTGIDQDRDVNSIGYVNLRPDLPGKMNLLPVES
jgi:hypothetical protein